MDFIIPKETLQKVLNYIIITPTAATPAGQVYDIINALRSCKPTESEELIESDQSGNPSSSSPRAS